MRHIFRLTVAVLLLLLFAVLGMARQHGNEVSHKSRSLASSPVPSESPAGRRLAGGRLTTSTTVPVRSHLPLVSDTTQTLAVTVPENQGIVLRLYRIGSDGTLTAISRTRLADTNEASRLQSLSFSRDGKFAYGCFFINGAGKQTIRQYRLANDGSLLPLAALPVGVGYNVSGVTFSPNGLSAYMVDRGGIWQMQRRRTGELTLQATPLLSLGQPVQRHNLRHEITKPGDKYSTFEIENNDTVSPLQIFISASGQDAYVYGHEYYYKGTEIVTFFGSHGGGTEIDEARFIIHYQVSPDGQLVSPTSRMPLPITTSSVVFDPSGRFLYAADRQNKTITPYRLLSDSVSPLRSSVVSGESLCLEPTGHSAYVATAGAIAQYHVQEDGGLIPLVPASVSVPTPEINGPHNPKFPPGQIRASLDGKFLFVRYTNYNTVVAAYAIGRDGVLSPQPTSIVPVSGEYGFGEITALPSVPQLSRSASTRNSPALSFPTRPEPKLMRTAQEFAYVLNSHDGTISQYRVSSAGTLQPLSPATINAGRYMGLDLPGSMTFDASQKFCYVPNDLGESVSQFRITANGTLTPLSPPAVNFARGVVPTEVATDPAGHYAYVAGQDDMKLHAFAIGQDGTLSAQPANDLPFSPGFGGLFVNSSLGMLLLRHGNGYVDSYRFGTDGHLNYSSRSQPSLEQPFTFDPTGKFAFYGDGYGQVWQFLVGADGSLKKNTPRAVPADEEPEAVGITPDGGFLYAANAGDFQGDGSISCYHLDKNGHLTALGAAPVLTGTSPTQIIIDPSGRFLYALDGHHRIFDDSSLQGVISQYRIMADGSLHPLVPARVTSGRGSATIVIVNYP